MSQEEFTLAMWREAQSIHPSWTLEDCEAWLSDAGIPWGDPRLDLSEQSARDAAHEMVDSIGEPIDG